MTQDQSQLTATLAHYLGGWKRAMFLAQQHRTTDRAWSADRLNYCAQMRLAMAAEIKNR